MGEAQEFRDFVFVELLERDSIELDPDPRGLSGTDAFHDLVEFSPAG